VATSPVWLAVRRLATIIGGIYKPNNGILLLLLLLLAYCDPSNLTRMDHFMPNSNAPATTLSLQISSKVQNFKMSS
jgi:hypothetical protein